MDIKLEDASIIDQKISFFARVVKVISILFLPVALIMGHPVLYKITTQKIKNDGFFYSWKIDIKLIMKKDLFLWNS